MKLNKVTLLFVILCWIFFVGAVGTFIAMNSADKQTTQNTTELVATIEKVEIANTGENVYIEIYTWEYDFPLYISTNVSNKLGRNGVNDLQQNQTIFFRVESHMLKHFDEISFINIVSLKSSDKAIFSLHDYNEYIYESAFPARIACVVVALIFLILAIHFSLMMKRHSVL